MSDIPPGWYPDHTDKTLQRYWDGTSWTEHTAPTAAPAAPVAPPAAPSATSAAPSAPSAPEPAASAFVAPTAVAPVTPAPLVPPYANSTVVPPHADTSAAPTAVYAPVAAPGAPRPRRTWIPIVIIAASVVVLLVIGGGVFAVVNLLNRGIPVVPGTTAGPTPDGSTPAGPDETGIFTADDLDAFSVGSALLPTAYEAFDSSFTDSTAGDGFATSDSEWLDLNGTPDFCEDLNFYEPFTTAVDAGSSDPIAAVGAYGDGTDALEAHARVFASEADASAQLANTDAAIAQCASGYGTDNFHADSVAPISISLPAGISSTGWQEQGLSGGESYYFETVEMQRGNLVVRANCYLPTSGGASPEVCGAWYEQVATDLSELTIGSTT